MSRTRRILALPFEVVEFVLMFGLVVPIQLLRSLPRRLNRAAIRLYYHTGCVPRRWVIGEDTWQPRDLAYLGIAPPKGHPWHDRRFGIVGHAPDGTPVIKPVTDHGTYATIDDPPDDAA